MAKLTKQKLGQLAFAHFSQAFRDELNSMHYQNDFHQDCKSKHHIEQDFKQNKLPKKLIIILGNRMCDYLDISHKRCMIALHKIHNSIQFYKKMIVAPDLAKAGTYSLSILMSPKAIHQKRHLGLTFIGHDSKYKGFNLFNFLADSADSAHDYAKAALSKIQNSSLLQALFSEYAYYCGDNLEQDLGYFNECFEDEETNFTKVLKSINRLFNSFLLENHIIEVNQLSEYELSKRTKRLLIDPQTSLALFFAKNPMAYNPNASWSGVMSYGLKALSWVSNHPYYNQYYGLAFAIEICSQSAFESFQRYTAIENKQTYDLGLIPAGYLSLVLPLYVSLLHNPFQILNLKSSRASTRNLMGHLIKVETTLHFLYTNKSFNLSAC